MNRASDPLPLLCHRQWHPRYESRPYRKHMHPSRREHIYGRVQPADPEPRAPRWHGATVIGLAIVAAYLSARYGWAW